MPVPAAGCADLSGNPPIQLGMQDLPFVAITTESGDVVSLFCRSSHSSKMNGQLSERLPANLPAEETGLASYRAPRMRSFLRTSCSKGERVAASGGQIHHHDGDQGWRISKENSQTAAWRKRVRSTQASGRRKKFALGGSYGPGEGRISLVK